MLDDTAGGNSGPIGGGSGAQVVAKVTLRLTPAHAAALAERAHASDVSQGAYVCALIDGEPPSPLAANHHAAVAALSTSTDRVAAISADLNVFMRLLGRGSSAELDAYRAGIVSLASDVRQHLKVAAVLIAELQPARRRRR
ncbi:hypothetical protein ACS5PN_17240 [Roseateles sp. NT4]|uniref:hypothetical protein n=1 Tax=Roseateles sp. NT4 TaxID=3453715 RepID=UPI003EEC0464